jgi:hypothetical protein
MLHPNASLTSRAPVTRPAGPFLVTPGRSFVHRNRTRPTIEMVTAPHPGDRRVIRMFLACGTSTAGRGRLFLDLKVGLSAGWSGLKKFSHACR